MLMIKLTLWLLALALAGFAWLAQGAARRRAAAAANWPTADGRVVTSEVTTRYSSNNYYTPAVTYAYEAGGVAYASDRLRPGGTPYFWSRKKADEIVARFPAGSTCVVRYDPRRPQTSALELTPQSWAVLLFAVFAGMTAILAAIFTVVLP